MYAVTTGSHTKEDLLNHHTQPQGIFPDLYELGEILFGFTPPPLKEKPQPLSLYSLT